VTIKRIKDLKGALGRNTQEKNILKDAVVFTKEKKWIGRSPLIHWDDQ
jgi:hypothetical protein